MQKLIQEYREPLVSIMNQFLDALYEERPADDPAIPKYETLRRTILDGGIPTKLEENLLIILLTFYSERFNQMAKDSARASQEFESLKLKIQEIVK